MSSSTDEVEQSPPEKNLDWSDVERIDQNMNGMFAQISHLKDTVVELQEENQRLRDDLETAESVAETALGVARAMEKGTDEVSKVDVSRRKSRNFLIKTAAENCLSRDNVTGKWTRDISASVTTSKVSDMAQPEVSLKWQSIVDGWDKLESSWDCFATGKNDNGNKVLKLVSQPPEAIVRAAERDLEETGFAKRLVGDLDEITGSEGGI